MRHDHDIAGGHAQDALCNASKDEVGKRRGSMLAHDKQLCAAVLLLDHSLAARIAAQLSFVDGADGVKQFDLCGWVECECVLYQHARGLRKVDRNQQALVGRVGWLAHDKDRTPGYSNEALRRAAAEKRPQAAFFIHGTHDKEVCALRFVGKILQRVHRPARRANAQAMALFELQGLVREMARRLGARPFAGPRRVDQLQRGVVLGSQSGSARERRGGARGQVCDGKNGFGGHGKATFSEKTGAFPPMPGNEASGAVSRG
jgi:hypothetical protein